MSKPSPPKPPSPKATSAAQTGTNIGTAIANNVMGMVDQTTPYGGMSYEQTGTYTYEDPYTGQSYELPRYSSTITLNDQQQSTLDDTQAAQGSLAGLAKDRSAYLRDYLNSPFDVSNAAEDNITELARRRVDPRMERERAALETKLANQGLQPGSAAWEAQMRNFGEYSNDAYTQIALQGRGQAFNEALTERNQPINEIVGLLSGSQVTNPSVSPTQPSKVPTTDVAGLINDNYQQRAASYQQQQAQRQSLMGGLFGLGASAITAFSDIRLKRDIERVGEAHGLPVYEFRYAWEPEGTLHRGVMAQEALQVMPEAVGEAGGFLTVDYSKLPEVAHA